MKRSACIVLLAELKVFTAISCTDGLSKLIVGCQGLWPGSRSRSNISSSAFQAALPFWCSTACPLRFLIPVGQFIVSNENRAFLDAQSIFASPLAIWLFLASLNFKVVDYHPVVDVLCTLIHPIFDIYPIPLADLGVMCFRHGVPVCLLSPFGDYTPSLVFPLAIVTAAARTFPCESPFEAPLALLALCIALSP